MTMGYAVTVAVVVTVGVFHLLGRDMIRMVVGIYILFNALNLLVLSVVVIPQANAPLGQLSKPYVDPLVQAMVLTAIVIGFGISTFLLLLTARLAKDKGSLDEKVMSEWKH